MQNPQGSLQQVNNIPYVLGGNNTPKLKRWMNQIGVPNYFHLELKVDSIAPGEMWKSAGYLVNNLSHVPLLFSVGLFADKILLKANLKHGALPSTRIKDQKKIMKAIDDCRNYFLERQRR